ncbi:hypothetical protein AMAG_13058 [Allomyces macrogynus ATCC 38327]|uniref:SLS1 N-terminal domain-containing protein n=1 Tax=Allomyces macrogynus (strain ATCC 38327) TaxID=578462 RepID=A0A0L0T0X6_ALLM3|nr:hypothetical protein AMAG_13058 [Allomyces macrogynus ATCC 38327]|eukprot:KNE68402.1 hypothetical protein AMAG_13058 [Allomyces macrogynus ATCC 38327]
MYRALAASLARTRPARPSIPLRHGPPRLCAACAPITPLQHRPFVSATRPALGNPPRRPRTLLSMPGSEPSAPSTNLLAFADFELNEMAVSSDSIDSLRPKSARIAATMTDVQVARLLQQLDSGFTKPQMVGYLSKNATNDVINAWLPAGTYLSAKTTIKKPKLRDAIVFGVWAVRHPTKGAPVPAAVPKEAEAETLAVAAPTNETDRDLVIERVLAIPDHVHGRLDVPCTDRDLFFIHGHGETARSLMLRHNVALHLDTDELKVTIVGDGRDNKKAVVNLRQLLHYKEALIAIPLEAKQSHKYYLMAHRLIGKIMRQCNVYIEEHGDKLHVTSTSLVNLSAAKQLLRSTWDLFQDTRWHVVAALEPPSAVEARYALLPLADPHWTDNKLFDGVPCWRFAPVSRLPLQFPDDADFTRHVLVAPPPAVAAPPRTSPRTDLRTAYPAHHATLVHYLSRLTTQSSTSLPRIDLETSFGTLAFFTPDDVGPAASSSTSTDDTLPTLFSAPVKDAVPVPDIQAWLLDARPEPRYVPTARRVLDWRPTAEELDADRHAALARANAVKQAKKKGKKSKNAAVVAPVDDSVDVGNRKRRWRLVYSTDATDGGNGEKLDVPGKAEIVVDLRGPRSAGAESVRAQGASDMVALSESGLRIESVEQRQVVLTVDTMDLERGTTLRTNAIVRTTVPDDFRTFYEQYMVPAMVVSNERVFAPASFLYGAREYTIKWAGRVVAETEQAEDVVEVEHAYAQANDGIEAAWTAAVARDVEPTWVMEESRWAAMVRAARGEYVGEGEEGVDEGPRSS